MKKLNIRIDYHTHWGESVYIYGNINQLGNGKIEEARALQCTADAKWSISIDIPRSVSSLEFKFLVKEKDKTTRIEHGEGHIAYLNGEVNNIFSIWQEEPTQKHFHSSLFSNSVFKHKLRKITLEKVKFLQFIVTCIPVLPSQELVISGNGILLGNWNEQNAIAGIPIAYGKWHFAFNEDEAKQISSYKFAIRDRKNKKITSWELNENRATESSFYAKPTTQEILYHQHTAKWRTTGVAIPIFSLRSEKSFGIGEFSDLNLLVDWAEKTNMKVIQVLPINDTTASYTWLDSYPYNAISIYALHPIYLGLHEHPLRDKTKNEKYKKEALKLNRLACIDYSKVIDLKTKYLEDLFEEKGEATLSEKVYKQFYDKNKHWLFPYACFCYLRDKHKTTNISDWGEFAKYDAQKLAKRIEGDKDCQLAIKRTYFTQYLLHIQLTTTKEYAYTKGVVLKGDIPIGISPNSVEAWTEPQLFKLDCQTGAPPDDFSVNGQNWGFPTYNWSEMQKDGYQWWVKRFQKMADYFDAYRIDHILGFFRIWEIPMTAVHGLLGYFSPALPLSVEEIASWGVAFDAEKMVTPRIHKLDISSLFGPYWSEDASEEFLCKKGDYFYLKPAFDNQRKIKDWFEAKGKKVASKYLQEGLDDEKAGNQLRDGLYELCNEVLFIRDKYETDKYHPRIGLQNSYAYKQMSEEAKTSINKLYDNFFYHRHSSFWREEAMNKLPSLINATNMLVCGEDLGMVPESVPSVMHDLQILSLEIERMPKQSNVRFADLKQLPYLSVITSSTHDMSPIRLWWEEEDATRQDYYNNHLCLDGTAPKICDAVTSLQIINNHLKSPAMLAILPLQDWLAISDKLKRKDPKEERINVPANPQHNWNYRLHIGLEDLVKDTAFSETIKRLNEESGRF